MKAYLIDEDQLAKLKRLYTELHSGSDRERDYGHRLWLVCAEIVKAEIEVDEQTGEIK